MNEIIYKDNKDFYLKLDELIKKNEIVTIKFDEDLLTKDSELWKRIRSCNNCKKNEEILKNIDKYPNLKTGLMTACLTGVEIVALVLGIIGIISSLFLLGYAIYKNYNADFEVDKNNGKIKIVLKPNNS